MTIQVDLMQNDWLFALVQHPMILVINEDRGIPEVGERISEWGAPDLETYVQRVRHNLDALQKYPDLKLNYEFSAIELKILAEHYPDIITAMQEFVKAGRLAFVGGDYSQAHGQLYSGELNFRQLEKGLEAFEKLVGYRVTNNFHQETCLHDQLPQLLTAFGFLTASPPVFSHTLEPLGPSSHPSFVFNDNTGYVPAASGSTALWAGLDGTELPVVVAGVSIGGFKTEKILMEAQKGLYRSSRLIITAPDMEEIVEEQYRFIKARGAATLLDAAVLSEVERQKPTWKLKLGTYWSYSEGMWAEAVYRKIREAESMLLAEEAQTIALGARKREGFEAGLETLLTAMHHDIHWVEVTDLKTKYINKLDQVIKNSKSYLAALFNGVEEACCGHPVRVVNTLPCARREAVRFTIAGQHAVKITGAEGNDIPALCIPSWEKPGYTDVLFIASVPGFGAADYFILSEDRVIPAGEECVQALINAGAGTYLIEGNGIVSRAVVSGRNVLEGPGHDLRYLDDTGDMAGGVSRPGTMLFYKGTDIDVLRVTAKVGDIPVEMEYVASASNKYLTISTRFHFNNNEIGIMWEDKTKLNCYWPVAGSNIRHDIPYGVSKGSEAVPVYAPSWISVNGENGGLAVINRGTPKHFVRDGVIGCVWAWGGRTFSNRMHLSWLKKDQYDLSLKGVQTIDSGIMVTEPELSEAEIAEAAQCFNTPLLVFGLEKPVDTVSCRKLPDLAGTGLIATAVIEKDGQIAYRCYEAEGKSHQVGKLQEILKCRIKVTDLKGGNLEAITPYRIGYIYFPDA